MQTQMLINMTQPNHSRNKCKLIASLSVSLVTLHVERGQPPKRTEAPFPPPISRSPTLRLVPPSVPQKHPLPLPAQIAWN